MANVISNIYISKQTCNIKFITLTFSFPEEARKVVRMQIFLKSLNYSWSFLVFFFSSIQLLFTSFGIYQTSNSFDHVWETYIYLALLLEIRATLVSFTWITYIYFFIIFSWFICYGISHPINLIVNHSSYLHKFWCLIPQIPKSWNKN